MRIDAKENVSWRSCVARAGSDIDIPSGATSAVTAPLHSGIAPTAAVADTAVYSSKAGKTT